MATPIFPYAHCSGSGWRDICDQLLGQLPGQNAGQLAFIYIADELAAQADRIIDYLRTRTRVPHWVGSIAQGICSTGKETYGQAAIAVMLTDWQADDFRIMPSLSTDTQTWLESIHSWRQANLASVAIVHGDPQQDTIPQLVEQLSDQLEGGFLVGGLTSAESLTVQIADRAVGNGLSGVLLSGKVPVSTGISQGCQLIGQKYRITESQRNIIMRLDGQPALEAFNDAVGPGLAANLEKVGGLIFVALPVPGSDTGDYLVRNLVGIDPEQKLIAIGDYARMDSNIQFARRDKASAEEDLIQMIQGLKARLPHPPKGALYHTCLGRGRHLFGEGSAEMKIIQEHLGDVPLIGFYANGEISHRRLYGYTGVLSVF